MAKVDQIKASWGGNHAKGKLASSPNIQTRLAKRVWPCGCGSAASPLYLLLVEGELLQCGDLPVVVLGPATHKVLRDCHIRREKCLGVEHMKIRIMETYFWAFLSFR